MIALIQRVSEASVTIERKRVAQIDAGMLALVGVEQSDKEETVEKLLHKLLHYRMFSDQAGKMNLNLKQAEGGLLLVSQFTLLADTSKGNRPGFSRGASAELGQKLFNQLVEQARERHQPVASGVFAADMKVQLINDGPVTFWLQV